MEIITLLKANIRHKKGSFISIIILMVIISTALTSFLSVRDNCRNSIQNALDEINAGDLSVFILESKLSNNLLDSVKNHPMVDHVEDYSAISSCKSEIGENTDGNSWFLRKYSQKYRLFNKDLTAYEKMVPSLNRGEIYIPQGIKTNMGCNIGDTIKIYIMDMEYNFTIKGFVVEPVNGSSLMGWKQVFISDEDFEQIYAEIKIRETEETTAEYHLLQIYKSSDCNLTDQQFKRQLNLDTGIIDNASGSLTKAMSLHYTALFPDIILSILMVFIGLLFIIVIIVIRHSISTSIEMDCVNLGVLKSQGFTKGKIRVLFVAQYLFSQIIGAVLGMILSIPLIKIMGNVFQPITAILADNNISIAESFSIMAIVLVISGVFIFFITRKAGVISPVRALSGGEEEIYFDSRLQTPVCQKGLMASLALRQFVSGKRRYFGTIIIVSILVFFMMTVTVLGNVLTSRTALESMGAIIYVDCDLFFEKDIDDETIEEIEKTVSEITTIEKKYYLNTMYLSINGEETYCQIYRDPEMITSILKGRAPLYENEIVITGILAEELNLRIGDRVMVSHNDKKEEYIISGFHQSLNDTGMVFAMSFGGAKKLGVDTIVFAGYSLKDSSKKNEVVDVLNEKFGDVLEATVMKESDFVDETYTIAIDAVKLVIYTFSIIFSLVVVSVVCAKTFLREKKDIGIYKALGFTGSSLRLQFAVRFLIVAVIGSGIGTVLSVLFTGKLLSGLLRLIGVSSFAVSYTATTFVAPVSIICVCFFLFAYIAARKIKRVEIKELIVE